MIDAVWFAKITLMAYIALSPLMAGSCPSHVHGAYHTIFPGIDGEGIILHDNEIAVEIALVHRGDDGVGTNNLLSGQIIQEISLVNTQVCHGTELRTVFAEKPYVRGTSPVLGAWMDEVCLKSQKLTLSPLSRSSFAFTCGFANH